MTAPPDDREIIARLEKIGGGDTVHGFRLLCVAARICSICGLSWANPDITCECTNQKTTKARGNTP